MTHLSSAIKRIFENKSTFSASTIFVWGVWAALTVAVFLFIRQYSRNIPFIDDFALVPMMVGREPVSLSWMWSQHNEHRPVISRLVMAGLHRYVASDFRAGQYVNAGILSATAAAMIVLARRLRGHTSLFDVALPLAILNIGQAETLMIGFAMNLILTSFISCALLGLASVPSSERRWPLTLVLGMYLVLLPLCGGSGLIMLPPLALWLIYDSIAGIGLRGACTRDKIERWIGFALLAACAIVVGMYMSGYKRPAHHPLPTSVASVGTTLVGYLSMVVSPNVFDYWQLAGSLVVFLVALTLARLAWVGWRQPEERARALGMVAVITAMLCAAVAVAVARAFIGSGGGRASRYITTTAPLFCALYVTWLVYGSDRARRILHTALLALVVIAIPANLRYGHAYGKAMRAVYTRVDRSLKVHSRLSTVVKRAWPELHPNQRVIERNFRLLHEAHVGRFGNVLDGDLAQSADEPRTSR